MKTIALTAAVTILTVASGTRTAQASDLSQMFRALETAQHTSARTVRPAPQPVAPAAPQLLLGAWLTDVDGRLQVTGTISGSPASQTLQPGDVLYRISTGGRTQTLRTLNQFEHAKRQIGPNRTTLLEVYRPGTGVVPMSITLATNGGLAHVALSQPVPGSPSNAAQAPGLASR